MQQITVVELKANWNGPLSINIPVEDLSKMRRWAFGGGILLILIGVWFWTDNLISGIFMIIIGTIILFLGIFIELIKSKQSFRGTSIDFLPNYIDYLYGRCEQFLKENKYHYKSIQENYGLLKGNGFELQPSGVRIIIFDVKAPLSGRVTRLGLRNINEQNLQEGIELQVKLDNYFVNNNLIGKNPQNIRTRYQWDSTKYIPMR